MNITDLMNNNIKTKHNVCAFCGKENKDVALMYNSELRKGISICDNCADQIYHMNLSIFNSLTNNMNNMYNSTINIPKELINSNNNKEDNNENKFNIPVPTKIKKYLDKHVIGQEEAKKRLSVAVYNHYKRIYQNTDDNIDIGKSNIAIFGKSGSGKTLLCQSIAKLLDVPFAIADCTSLTEAGYVGDDVETIITRLLQASDYNIEKTEIGIIFLDELDKIANKNNGNPSITRDVSGEGVQQGLLKMLEGSIVQVPPKGGRKHPDAKMISVNTKNILFICAGAFVGLDKKIEKRYNKNKSIGFTSITDNNKSKKLDKNENPLKYINNDDLIKYGLIPELVGRIPVITYVNELTKEDLKKILIEPENAIIKQYEKLFKLDNIKLSIDDDVYDYIVDCAVKMKVGARGLRTIVETLLNDDMYKLPGTNRKKLHVTLKYAKGKLTNMVETYNNVEK